MKTILLSIFIAGSIQCFGQNLNEDQVVPSFELLLKNYINSYKIDNRERVTLLGGGWVTEKFDIDTAIKYDVQKTSSLISPYTDYAEFTIKQVITSFHKTKEDALNDTTFITTKDILHKHYYAIQKGKWTVIKREHYSPALDNWYDCEEDNNEGENKEEKDLLGCLEKI